MERKKQRKRFPLFLILFLSLALGFGLFSWYSWEKDWESTRKFVPVRIEKVLAGNVFTAYIPTMNVIQDVRLIGVTIPAGEKADKSTTIAENLLEGKAVYIETDTQLNNQINEILAYVWLEKPDKITEDAVKSWNYNCLLIQGDYADTDLSNPYNKKYNEIFQKAQTNRT